MYSFSGPDGAAPLAGLVQSPGGNLYGTTTRGGALDGGTIFRITPGGSLSTLYDFDGASGTDGWAPVAGLIQAADENENFYGMTSAGAVAGVSGTIFTVTPAGRLTTLHRFNMTNGGSLSRPQVIAQSSRSLPGRGDVRVGIADRHPRRRSLGLTWTATGNDHLHAGLKYN